MTGRFLGMPRTRLGKWSIWLEIAFVVLFAVNIAVFSLVTDETIWRQTVLPFYGPIMLLCGLAGGVVGLIATTRKHERSSLVWLAILTGLFVLLLILNELIQLVQYLRGS